jgi:hypothetical protein
VRLRDRSKDRIFAWDKSPLDPIRAQAIDHSYEGRNIRALQVGESACVPVILL